jgi:hypothetical protein
MLLGMSITRNNKSTHCDKRRARLHTSIFSAIAAAWSSQAPRYEKLVQNYVKCYQNWLVMKIVAQCRRHSAITEGGNHNNQSSVAG